MILGSIYKSAVAAAAGSQQTAGDPRDYINQLLLQQLGGSKQLGILGIIYKSAVAAAAGSQQTAGDPKDYI